MHIWQHSAFCRLCAGSQLFHSDKDPYYAAHTPAHTLEIQISTQPCKSGTFFTHSCNRERRDDTASSNMVNTFAACRYNAQAHVNRGVVLLEAGSLEEALQAFSDAAAIQPLNVQALYNLG